MLGQLITSHVRNVNECELEHWNKLVCEASLGTLQITFEQCPPNVRNREIME